MLQRRTLLCVLVIASSLLLSDSAIPHLDISPDSQCACLNSVLTYTCTAVGGGSTLWTGTAFNCTNNHINLRHSLFNSSDRTATGGCNNEAIVGRSVGVMDDCYTSQLNVRVSAGLNNKTIRCDHRPGTETNTIGQSTLTVITAPLPPPNDVQPISLLQGNLTFQWTSVAPACFSKLVHTINSSDCGNCILSSSSASAPTATCSNIPLPMTTCSFSVQSVVCVDQVGELSSPVEVLLKVPDIPHANILPVYSDDSKVSAKVMITNNQTIFNGDFSVPVISYNFSFSNSTSGIMLDSVNTSPCADDVCEYLPDVSTYCRPMGNISVAVSAANELGIGLPSDPISVECTNNLVQVEYNTITSTITCVFNDPRNITGKSCTIEYGICNTQQMGKILEGSTSVKSPNIVTLSLQSIDPNQMYCYNVTASNNSYTVIVMGSIGMDGGSSNPVAITAAIVITVLILAITVVVIILVVMFLLRRNKPAKPTPQVVLEEDNEHVRLEQLSSNQPKYDKIKEELKLSEVDSGCFEFFEVVKDCQLREFLFDINHKFEAGYVYYEFQHEVEHVSEDKQLVFMKGKDFFIPTVELRILKKNGFFGEKVERPELEEDYKLFVQSTSASGSRHLPAGSMLLYRTVSLQGTKTPSLRPLISDHFKITEVDCNCTLKEFCKNQGIQPNKFNVFMELDAAEGGRQIRDVLLAKKGTNNLQSTPELFTGPSIRQTMLGGLHGLEMIQEEWRIFVIMETPFKDELKLKMGSLILHEHHSMKEESFHVLHVEEDEDNTQMSKFFEKNLGYFENGKAFYEFKDKEDLIFYKEVVREQKNKIASCDKTLFVQPDVSNFYSLSKAAPGKGIKLPDLQHVRVFVQSTSYGSRCLKTGATVLYKIG